MPVNVGAAVKLPAFLVIVPAVAMVRLLPFVSVPSVRLRVVAISGLPNVATPEMVLFTVNAETVRVAAEVWSKNKLPILPVPVTVRLDDALPVRGVDAVVFCVPLKVSVNAAMASLPLVIASAPLMAVLPPKVTPEALFTVTLFAVIIAAGNVCAEPPLNT